MSCKYIIPYTSDLQLIHTGSPSIRGFFSFSFFWAPPEGPEGPEAPLRAANAAVPSAVPKVAICAGVRAARDDEIVTTLVENGRRAVAS